jgi:hypothetical protein
MTLPPSTTPAEVTPQVANFCASIVEEPLAYVPVRPVPGAQPFMCHHNVDLHIKMHGGRVLYGWVIWETPRTFLDAEFHSVWVAPTGELVDITPKNDGEERILFLRDPSKSYDLRRPGPQFENIGRPLVETPATRALMSGKRLRKRLTMAWQAEERATLRKDLRLEGPISPVKELLMNSKARRMARARLQEAESFDTTDGR